MKVEPKTGKATIDFLLLSHFMFQFLHFHLSDKQEEDIVRNYQINL